MSSELEKEIFYGRTKMEKWKKSERVFFELT